MKPLFPTFWALAGWPRPSWLAAMAAAALCASTARADTFEVRTDLGVWSDPDHWRRTAGSGFQDVPSEPGDIAQALFGSFGTEGADVTSVLDDNFFVRRITAVGSGSPRTARTWLIEPDIFEPFLTLDREDTGPVTLSTTANSWALQIDADLELVDNDLVIQNANGSNNNITINGAIMDFDPEDATNVSVTNNRSDALIKLGTLDLEGTVTVTVGSGVAQGPENGRVEIAGTITGTVAIVKNTLASNTESTLTLSGVDNDYDGGTTINGGGIRAISDFALGAGDVTVDNASGAFLTLELGSDNDYIDDFATLTLSGTNSRVNLNYIGTDTVGALIINGQSLAPGLYGAPTNLAIPDGNRFTNFTGTGALFVVPEPSSALLVVIGGLIGTAMVRRRSL